VFTFDLQIALIENVEHRMSEKIRGKKVPASRLAATSKIVESIFPNPSRKKRFLLLNPTADVIGDGVPTAAHADNRDSLNEV
jgi:hypothetical protein